MSASGVCRAGGPPTRSAMTPTSTSVMDQPSLLMGAGIAAAGECRHAGQWLFLVTQQFSLRVPNLQAVSVDYVMIWPQRFGGLDCQFERLKRLHGMAVMGRDMKRGVQGMALFGYSEKFA
jgi:hypothetical protein